MQKFTHGIIVSTPTEAFQSEAEAIARVEALKLEGVIAEVVELGPPCDEDGNILEGMTSV